MVTSLFRVMATSSSVAPAQPVLNPSASIPNVHPQRRCPSKSEQSPNQNPSPSSRPSQSPGCPSWLRLVRAGRAAAVPSHSALRLGCTSRGCFRVSRAILLLPARPLSDWLSRPAAAAALRRGAWHGHCHSMLRSLSNLMGTATQRRLRSICAGLEDAGGTHRIGRACIPRPVRASRDSDMQASVPFRNELGRF